MKAIEESEGGTVIVANLTWIGPVQPVKKSGGKGSGLEETTVYNFFMRSGFQSFKTVDYATLAEANDARRAVMQSIVGEGEGASK